MSTDRNNISVGLLKSYMGNDLNILISGPAGTGKTTMLKAAAEELGLKMKYYETPTLDPFTDLVGIPVPNKKTETIKYFRPHDIDSAEVLFFDEINRADPRVLNAVFEIIQFKTINGEPLPNLRVVVAAMNPNDGDYTVDQLDVALQDRFDIFLAAMPRIDMAYFTKKYNREVASAVAQWWGEVDRNYRTNRESSTNRAVYISPRRMDKIVSAFEKLPKRSTIQNSITPGAVVNVAALHTALTEAFGADSPVDSGIADTTASNLLSKGTAELRGFAAAAEVNSIIKDANVPERDKLLILNNLAVALSRGISVENIFKLYGDVITEMRPAHFNLMQNKWARAKREEFHTILNESKLHKF